MICFCLKEYVDSVLSSSYSRNELFKSSDSEEIEEFEVFSSRSSSQRIIRRLNFSFSGDFLTRNGELL